MRTISITLDEEALAAVCRRFEVAALYLFGSVLGEHFGPESDVDVLVEFAEGKTLTLETYVEMREELSRIFGGREVDLVEGRRLADPYRRHEIMRTREQVYGR